MKGLKKFKSMILLVITAIIWGLAFVAQEVGAEYVGTFTFNGVRFFLGALSLIPVVLLFEREKLDKAQFKKLIFASVLTGTVLFAASALQQYGVQLGTPAGKAGFITGLYTVIVPIMSLIVLRRRTNILVWIGAVLAVCGLLLLNLDEKFTLAFGAGELSLFIGAIVWAVHILVIDKFVAEVSPLKFSMGQFIVCAVESIICALLFEDISLSGIQMAAVPILYGGLLSVGVAYTCQALGQKDSDPTAAAIVLSMESVFSVIGGIIILNAHMEIQGYIGCMLIFVGIVLAQIKFQNKKKQINNEIANGD